MRRSAVDVCFEACIWLLVGAALALSILMVTGCSTSPGSKSPVAEIRNATKAEKPYQREAEEIARVMAVVWVNRNLAGDEMTLEKINSLPRPGIWWVSDRCPNIQVPSFMLQGQCLGGVHYRWSLMFVADYPMIHQSAFAHELGHAYRRIILGDGDGDHVDKAWWKYWEHDVNTVIGFHEVMRRKGKDEQTVSALPDRPGERHQRCLD